MKYTPLLVMAAMALTSTTAVANKSRAKKVPQNTLQQKKQQLKRSFSSKRRASPGLANTRYRKGIAEKRWGNAPDTGIYVPNQKKPQYPQITVPPANGREAIQSPYVPNQSNENVTRPRETSVQGSKNSKTPQIAVRPANRKESSLAAIYVPNARDRYVKTQEARYGLQRFNIDKPIQITVPPSYGRETTNGKKATQSIYVPNQTNEPVTRPTGIFVPGRDQN